MSTQYVDYYKVLGISKQSSKTEIQKAYRTMARKYHPDVNKSPGAEAQFKKVTEAYEVLKNPETKERYDTLGSGFRAGDRFTPPSGWQNIPFNFGQSPQSGFSDFFEMIFGDTANRQGGRGQHHWSSHGGPAQGQDINARLSISLEDAFSGGQKTLSLNDPQTGEKKTYKVKIPLGTLDGTKIRLKGQGLAGAQGAPSGDLYFLISIQEHPLYKIDGKDLEGKIFLSPWEAALGAIIKYKTLTGTIDLKIPVATQSGSIMRLRNKGFHNSAGKGDLLATVLIQVPSNLTKEEKRLFEALKDKSSFSPR